MLTRTRCFTPASTAKAAQPARAVRMVVRASSQKQQLPSIVKPAVIAAGRRSLRSGRGPLPRIAAQIGLRVIFDCTVVQLKSVWSQHSCPGSIQLSAADPSQP